MAHSQQAFPGTPQDFVAAWAASRGNLRRFLEQYAFPPIGPEPQRLAGYAAARQALAATPDLTMADLESGLDSVSGAIVAADEVGLTPPNLLEPKVAAFFDVDNTLIQGVSLSAFARGLFRYKYLSWRDVVQPLWKQIKFRVRGKESAEDMLAAREQALQLVKGKDVAELVRLCELIVETEMDDRIFPGTKAIAEAHIAAGEQVWLVSATPVQIAQVMAKHLGFTGALGTVAEVVDGKFTGRLAGDVLHGPGKRHAVAALAAVANIDLAASTAYSDSLNDLPLLTLVGNSVAINPDAKLRRYAKTQGWPVEDFRSVRKALRTYGAPTLLAAAASWASWHLSKRRG